MPTCFLSAKYSYLPAVAAVPELALEPVFFVFPAWTEDKNFSSNAPGLLQCYIGTAAAFRLCNEKLLSSQPLHCAGNLLDFLESIM